MGLRTETVRNGRYASCMTTCQTITLDYEEEMKNIGQTPDEKQMMDKFKDMNEMYVSGSREILKIW